MSRFERLAEALQRGERIADFARTEGVTSQAISDWIAKRPDYARQIAKYRRGGRRKPITGAIFQMRVEAIKRRLRGHRWKAVANEIGLDDTVLRAWFYSNRQAVLDAIADSERRAA